MSKKCCPFLYSKLLLDFLDIIFYCKVQLVDSDEDLQPAKKSKDGGDSDSSIEIEGIQYIINTTECPKIYRKSIPKHMQSKKK